MAVPSLRLSRRQDLTYNHVAWLAREAWFYDELERFQGSVIPYCFGWFETELPAESRIPALDFCPDNYDSDYDSDDNEEEEDPEALKSYEGGEIHPLLAERHSRRDIVAVLVLERLGGMLPLCQPVDKTFGAGKDIYSMYRELGEIGIVPWDDIRRENERFVKCNYSRHGCRTMWAGDVVQMFSHVSNGIGHVYSDDELESDETANSDDKQLKL